MTTIMISKYRYIVAALVAGAMLASCEDDDHEYVPGEQDAADCMGVYFDADTPDEFLIMDEADYVTTITVHRLNSTSAASVPLVVTSTTDAIVFPSTVDFEAGSADATFEIDFTNMPTKQQETFSVTVPDSYIAHYKATNFDFKATALASQWEDAMLDGSDVIFFFSEKWEWFTDATVDITQSTFEPVVSKMQTLPGAARFRVLNLLNTGIDVTFSVALTTYEDYAGYYRISPLTNYRTMVDAYAESDPTTDYGDPYYNGWYVYDSGYGTANLVFRDSGKEAAIEGIGFWHYSESSGIECCFASLKEADSTSTDYNVAVMAVTTNDEDYYGLLPSWLYLSFRWDGPSGL